MFPGALACSEVSFIVSGVSSQTHGSRGTAIRELRALLFGEAGGGGMVGSSTLEMQELSPLEQLQAVASVSLRAPGSPSPGL